MHHFDEKTKINLDFGRFCIIFVLGFMSLLAAHIAQVQIIRYLCNSIC